MRDAYWYNERKAEYILRINEHLAMQPGAHGVSATIRETLPVSYYSRGLARIYDNLLQEQDWEYLRFAMVVRADSLIEPASEQLRRFDRIARVAEIKVGENGLKCWHSMAPKIGDKQIPTVWTVKDLDDDRLLTVTPMPIERPGETGPVRGECLLFFDNEAPMSLAGKRLRIESVNLQKGAMDDLREAGRTFIGFHNKQAVPIQTADVVLISPSAIGPLGAVLHPQKAARELASRSRELSAVEQRAYPSLALNDYLISGFRTENLGKDIEFYAEFFPSSERR